MDVYQHLFEHLPDGLLVVDEDGRVNRANRTAARLFGYEASALDGLPIESLVPERLHSRHRAHRHAFQADPHARAMGLGLELLGCRADGSEFPVDVMLSPMQTGDRRQVVCVVRDVTEQVRARQLLLASLAEKEVLLKEVHHRVKNNLAVIASLLYLESTTTTDEPVLKLLQESRDRVRSMSLVHETLYQSGTLSSVDFADYARTLGDELARSFRGPGEAVRLHTDMQPVLLGIDIAVPCGLILNELLTNAFKHAYPGAEKGIVEIHLRRLDAQRSELRVVDHGVGLAASVVAGQSGSLGQRLVRSLARQLDATFDYLPAAQGTHARLVLNIERP